MHTEILLCFSINANIRQSIPVIPCPSSSLTWNTPTPTTFSTARYAHRYNFISWEAFHKGMELYGKSSRPVTPNLRCYYYNDQEDPVIKEDALLKRPCCSVHIVDYLVVSLMRPFLPLSLMLWWFLFELGEQTRCAFQALESSCSRIQ